RQISRLSKRAQGRVSRLLRRTRLRFGIRRAGTRGAAAERLFRAERAQRVQSPGGRQPRYRARRSTPAHAAPDRELRVAPLSAPARQSDVFRQAKRQKKMMFQNLRAHLNAVVFVTLFTALASVAGPVAAQGRVAGLPDFTELYEKQAAAVVS